MSKLLVPVIIIILLAVVGYLYIDSFETSAPPISSEPLTTNTPEPSGTPIVGGDKDEHGCIGSAGYTWCEEKQKCLRAWEEPCNGPSCGLQTCHGLNLSCGYNSPIYCTAVYEIGDKCLEYAKCGYLNGICQPIENAQFTQCKSCVQACIDVNKDDSIKMFECESKCN